MLCDGWAIWYQQVKNILKYFFVVLNSWTALTMKSMWSWYSIASLGKPDMTSLVAISASLNDVTMIEESLWTNWRRFEPETEIMSTSSDSSFRGFFNLAATKRNKLKNLFLFHRCIISGHGKLVYNTKYYKKSNFFFLLKFLLYSSLRGDIHKATQPNFLHF